MSKIKCNYIIYIIRTYKCYLIIVYKVYVKCIVYSTSSNINVYNILRVYCKYNNAKIHDTQTR